MLPIIKITGIKNVTNNGLLCSKCLCVQHSLFVLHGSGGRCNGDIFAFTVRLHLRVDLMMISMCGGALYQCQTGTQPTNLTVEYATTTMRIITGAGHHWSA
jgi:hypothetical protein